MNLDPNCPKCNAILSVVLWRLGNCPFCVCELPPYREQTLSPNVVDEVYNGEDQVSQDIDKYVEQQLGKAPELPVIEEVEKEDPAVLLARELLDTEDSFTRLAVSSPLSSEPVVQDEEMAQWMEKELDKELETFSGTRTTQEVESFSAERDLTKKSDTPAVKPTEILTESNSERALLTAVTLKSEVSALSQTPSLVQRLQELKLEQVSQFKTERDLSLDDRFNRIDEKVKSLEPLPTQKTVSPLAPPKSFKPPTEMHKAETDLAFERLEERVLAEQSKKDAKVSPSPLPVEKSTSLPPVPKTEAVNSKVEVPIEKTDTRHLKIEEVKSNQQDEAPTVMLPTSLEENAKSENITENPRENKATPQTSPDEDAITDFLEELDEGRFHTLAQVKESIPKRPHSSDEDNSEGEVALKVDEKEQDKQFLENDYQELSYSKSNGSIVSRVKEEEPELKDLIITKSTDDFKKVPKESVKPVEKKPQEEVKQRNRTTTPSEKINKGKNPDSMFFIRGVLHNSPFRVLAGSFLTIFAWIACPLIVLGLVWVMWFAPLTEYVKKWTLVGGLLAFPLVLIIYAIASQGAKCTVCGSKQYVPRGNRKHVRAARFPLLGTLIPTAFHALFLKWFRCRDCGTPNRLKD